LFHTLHATQLNDRPPPRFFRRHAAAEIVFHVHLEMTFHLGGELAVALPSVEHPAYALKECS